MKPIKQKPIPYALDGSGNTFLPARGQNGLELYCPDCHQPIEPRTEGKKIPPYYAHKRERSPGCCFGGGGESPEHRQACHSVKALLLRMMANASSISLDLMCEMHSQRNRIDWIPSKGTVLVDKPIPGKLFPKEYRPDVALIGEAGEINLCIEIWNTNKVSIEKEDAFNAAGIRWIEIDLAGTDIERTVLTAIRHGGFGEMNCCIMANSPHPLRQNPPIAERDSIYFNGLRWSAQVPDSITQRLVIAHSAARVKWDWQAILDKALEARSRNEEVEVAVRRIMAEHGFSKSNGVVRRFLILAKVLVDVALDEHERPAGSFHWNELTPWSLSLIGRKP